MEQEIKPKRSVIKIPKASTLNNNKKVVTDEIKRTVARPKIIIDRIDPKLKLTVEETALQKKFELVTGKNILGKLEIKDKNIWYYKGGCLCYNSRLKKAFEIHGDIYKKWKTLGGIKWGIPDTDELTCPDKIGRYNHFNNSFASIYWSPKSGAQGIWGDIRKKWASLGYERSYLGYPITDEVDFPEKGKANGFQNGDIYWWGDTNAIDLKGVVINYKGIYCSSETNADQSSNSDEPYVIMSISYPEKDGAKSFKSKIYEDVDSKEIRADFIEIFRGKPYGINIATTIMEHDFGNVEKTRKEIEKGIKSFHKVGMSALGSIPLIGPAIASFIGPVLSKFMPEAGKFLFDIFGFGDDLIGNAKHTLTAKQMIVLAANTKSKTYKGLTYKFNTGVLKGKKDAKGAAYTAYYTIDKIQ